MNWKTKAWITMIALLLFAFALGLAVGYHMGTESNWVVIG